MTVPSAAAEKSRFADQAPAAHATVAEAAPEMTTFRPFSEQVPETAKEAAFAEPIRLPAAGEVIATVGAAVSFTKERFCWTAEFPAVSE